MINNFTLNSNLKRAIIIVLIINSFVVFSGFYGRTYDSYGHMFFADHYQKSWFNPWEPRWYAGFNVESYPPLAHQTLALLGFVTGLEFAYVIITLILMTLMPIAAFYFSRVFVSDEAAGYAALISAFLPGILYSVYIWGQFTTLFGLVIALFTGYSFHNFMKKGGFICFAELVLFFEIGVASHHFSGLVFSPLLLFAIFLSLIAKKEVVYRIIFKRLLLFTVVGSLLSLVIVYPVIYGAVSQNVNIPHPTTMNYFQNLELLRLFFVNIYGFFLLLIPLAVIIVYRQIDHHGRNLWALLVMALFFLFLGLGGTTILPQLVFGGNWLGLTYERFGLFASVTFLPLFGMVFVHLKKTQIWRPLLIIFLVFCLLFAAGVTSDTYFRVRPQQVPVDGLVDFLNHGSHSSWRYLTLGFDSSDFCKLTLLSNASTIDGWYYRGRDIPALANSGVSYLSGAKYAVEAKTEPNAIPVLRSILENASQYNLRFIFCNDRYYESLLNETGFTQLNQTYEQVTIWAKYDSAPLEISQLQKTNSEPLDYLWGILPIGWLAGLAVVFSYRLYLKREYLKGVYSRWTKN
jgi:hypothetical protein